MTRDDDMTAARIVREASRRYVLFCKAGDSSSSALDKAIAGALLKLWRRRIPDMTKPANLNRYGGAMRSLRELVTEASPHA